MLVFSFARAPYLQKKVSELVFFNLVASFHGCSYFLLILFLHYSTSGMNKMVINHLDKLFVTNDAATIVNELEVQHPAAKVLVLAGKAQQEEIGDGANLTISFAGELLQNAEELIRMGLHPSEIISGYTKAINKVCKSSIEKLSIPLIAPSPSISNSLSYISDYRNFR